MLMAKTGSLRIVPPSLPEEPEPIDVEIPNEDPNARLDGGALHIEHEDGSTTIDFSPDLSGRVKEAGEGFYRNLVEEIDKDALEKLASELSEGIERDIESRKEWEETKRRGIQLLGIKLEEPRGDLGKEGASVPLEGMSTVRHPLLLDAVVNFQATARGELLPAEGPCKVRNDLAPFPAEPVSPSVPASAIGPGPNAGGAVSPTSAPPAPNPMAAPPAQPAGLPPSNPPLAGMPTPGQPPSLQEQFPMATEYVTPPMEEKDTLAATLEMFFNHYLTVTAREYYPDTDRMLFYIPLIGDGFKKVFNCPLRRRPVSESIDAEDLIVSNSATDLANCARVTHRIKMRKSVLRRMQILGVYADFELPLPAVETKDVVKQEKDAVEGNNDANKKQEDLDYTIYESYCEWELDQFAPKDLKDKGLPLPYRVTLERDTKKVLSVVRNWKEEDEQAIAKQYFVQFPFIRGIGFYGLGFIHLLGNTTNTLTAMWREMVDAGMFANFPGFITTKAASRQLSNQYRVPPGGGIALDVPFGGRIQDSVMPVPYKEPGAAFTQFAQWVEQAGQRLAQTGQIAVGEGKQEVPVGTTLALIEQATKIINSAHKRLHAAQGEEFVLLKERFQEDPAAFFRHKPKAMRWEKEQFVKALNDYHIVPVADPNNPTSLHRAAKAQIIEGTASKYPQYINGQAALKRVYRIAGIDTEGLFYPQPLPPPPDPRMAAIKQKADSTQQTVQMQTQSTLQKSILQAHTILKQVEVKHMDRQSREKIEQARMMLDAMQAQHDMANERQQAEQERQLEHQKAQDDRAIKWQDALHDAHTERVKAGFETQTERMKMGHEAQSQAIEREQERQQAQDERARAREEHYWDMERRQQEHEQKMKHQSEMHEAQLANEKALARIKKKSDNKPKSKEAS